MAKRAKGSTAKRASASPPEAPRRRVGRRLGRRRVAVLLFFGLTLLFFCNFRLRGSGDSLPTRVLPFSILNEGNLDLNEFTWARFANRDWPYYIHGRGEGRDRKFYSVSPIATSLVVTPLYVLPSLWLAWNDVPYVDARARAIMVLMEKLSAAVLTALSAALLYLLLCRLTTQRWSLALALVYALGTSTWSISSQALWAHALAQLCLVALCLLLARDSLHAWRLAAIAAVCALMVANRPQMAIFAAVTGAYLVWRDRRLVLPLAAVALLFGGALAAYNLSTMGFVTGGYGGFDHFSNPFFEGLGGLTVSPNRGLFVYTPILAFSLWGSVQVWRGRGPAWLRFFTIGLGLHVVLYAKFDDWYAGFSYGPRYFTDVLPVLVVLLVYGLIPLCRRAPVRAAALLLALWGVAVQAIGVYAADDGWNRDPISVDTRPQRVWDWNDTQIGRSLRSGFKGFELLPVLVDAFTDPVPARLVELAQDDLSSRVEVIGMPAVMRPGERRMLRVRVTNRAAAAWPAFSGKGLLDIAHLVFLVQTWSAAGRQLQGFGEVELLPENVAPGETVELEMPLTAPPRRGPYEVDFRPTQAIDGIRGVPSPDGARFRVRVE